MSDAEAVFDAVQSIQQTFRAVADEWVRERGLSVEQGRTLGFLVEHPGSIQRDLAVMAGTSSASVTGLLRVLERRGLIERRSSTTDERVKHVYATMAGTALVDGFDRDMAEAKERALADMDPARRAALVTTLNQVWRLLQAEPA